ncbi:hypothetical protein QTO34_015833 [Cnephaeus nilssonii]|uniref:3-ketoacyl-[acyl-carrier-protein] reductase beta subunit n=1 Tax=Cnephaeus nilssonii TaxID=3371016 RepID=A0AA40I535_CNENI|nr:hypothetical protein QTO34_015833 [Eptesicus nilssonii]
MEDGPRPAPVPTAASQPTVPFKVHEFVHWALSYYNSQDLETAQVPINYKSQQAVRPRSPSMVGRPGNRAGLTLRPDALLLAPLLGIRQGRNSAAGGGVEVLPFEARRWDSLLVSTKTEDVITQLHTNLLGFMLTCKAAMKTMIQQQRGSIVNVDCSGVGNEELILGHGDLKADGLRAIYDKSLNEEHLKKNIPLGRFGDPIDVAHAVVFLLESPYITGHVLVVDGGLQLTIESMSLDSSWQANRIFFAVSCEYPYFDVFFPESLDDIKDAILEPVFNGCGSQTLEVLLHLLLCLVQGVALVLKKDAGLLVPLTPLLGFVLIWAVDNGIDAALLEVMTCWDYFPNENGNQDLWLLIARLPACLITPNHLCLGLHRRSFIRKVVWKDVRNDIRKTTSPSMQCSPFLTSPWPAWLIHASVLFGRSAWEPVRADVDALTPYSSCLFPASWLVRDRAGGGEQAAFSRGG